MSANSTIPQLFIDLYEAFIDNNIFHAEIHMKFFYN